MKRKNIRIPGKAARVFVIITLGIGTCVFLAVTVAYILKRDFLTAVFAAVATIMFGCGLRFAKQTNDDYYFIDDTEIQIRRNGKKLESIQWKDLTSVSIEYAPYKGNEWLYIVLRVQKMCGDECIEDKRISVPSPVSRFKFNFLLEQANKHNLNIKSNKGYDPRPLRR